MDAVKKLREAYKELLIARDMVKHMEPFRRGGLGLNNRKQARNLSDGAEFGVQHIEAAMKLLAEVGKALKKSGPR